MGPAGLTAVFGMGTGVAPPVWSPGIPPPGGEARRRRAARWSVTTNRRFGHTPSEGDDGHAPPTTLCGSVKLSAGHRRDRARPGAFARGADRGGQAARLLGPVG